MKGESVMVQINKDEDDNTVGLLGNYNDDEFEKEYESLQKRVNSNDDEDSEVEILTVDVENEESQGLLAESSTLGSPSNSSSSTNSSTHILNPSPKKERQYWIDALRILASYMVVLVHSSSYAIFEVPIFTLNWYGLMFWDAMSRTCVPLFVMISGILFLNPEKEITVSKIFKKYISRIVKTLIFWNAFYGTVVKYQVNAFKTGYKFTVDIIPDFFNDVIYGKFHMWYLYMCIGLYMITPLLRPITKDKRALKYFVILSMTVVQVLPFVVNIINHFKGKSKFNIISDVLGKLALYFVGGYSCLYVLGYYLSCVEIKSKFMLFIMYIGGLLLLLFTYGIKMVLSILHQKEITDYGDYNALNVSLTAIIIFLFFKHTGSKIINKLIRVRFFKFLLLKISQLSFGIYLIHVFYFELFFRLKFHSYTFTSFIFSPIHAFIIWMCSLLTVSVLQYIPYVKDFL